MSHQYDTDHSELRLCRDQFTRLAPMAVEAMDQPTFDGVYTYVVSREARRTGLTVALSGIGADELFGGYPSFTQLLRLRRAQQFIPSAVRRPIASLIRGLGHDSDQARKLGRMIEKQAGPDEAPEVIARELFSPTDRHRLVPGSVALRDENGGLPGQLGDLDSFNSVSYFELSRYLRHVLLRDTDTMSMANSLEVREPLLDHELVQLIAARPGEVKRHGGPKALLVQAMRGDLPKEILYRKKMGFTLPFAEWLRGPLRDPVERVLMDTGLGGEVAETLDGEAVKEVWARFVAGSATWVRPWALYVLKVWGSRFG